MMDDEDDEEELQSCEQCGSECLIEDAVSMSDCWFCPKCYVEWKACFDACTHQWSPHYDEHGDPGQYCERCGGFVNDEDMAALFPRAS